MKTGSELVTHRRSPEWIPHLALIATDSLDLVALAGDLLERDHARAGARVRGGPDLSALSGHPVPVVLLFALFTTRTWNEHNDLDHCLRDATLTRGLVREALLSFPEEHKRLLEEAQAQPITVARRGSTADGVPAVGSSCDHDR
jgi:hypothetical protein